MQRTRRVKFDSTAEDAEDAEEEFNSTAEGRRGSSSIFTAEAAKIEKDAESATRFYRRGRRGAQRVRRAGIQLYRRGRRRSNFVLP